MHRAIGTASDDLDSALRPFTFVQNDKVRVRSDGLGRTRSP